LSERDVSIVDRERASAWMKRDYITRRHALENPGVVDDLAIEFASARNAERDFMLNVAREMLDRPSPMEEENAKLTAALNGMADGVFYNGKEIDRLRERVSSLLVEKDMLKEDIKKIMAEREQGAEP
jgi:hypothetical protein